MIFAEQIFALSCVAVIEKEGNQRAYCVFCNNVLKVLFSLFFYLSKLLSLLALDFYFFVSGRTRSVLAKGDQKVLCRGIEPRYSDLQSGHSPL